MGPKSLMLQLVVEHHCWCWTPSSKCIRTKIKSYNSNTKQAANEQGFIKGLKLIVSRSDSNANIRAQVRKPSSGNLNHLNLDKLIHNFFKSKFIKV